MVEETIPGQPSAGITIKFSQIPGNELPWLTDDFADYATFANTAPDGKVVRYNTNPDGTPTKQIIYIKTPNGVMAFQSKEDNDKIYQAKGNYLTQHQSLDGYAKTAELVINDNLFSDMPARPVLTADANQNHNGGIV